MCHPRITMSALTRVPITVCIHPSFHNCVCPQISKLVFQKRLNIWFVLTSFAFLVKNWWFVSWEKILLRVCYLNSIIELEFKRHSQFNSEWWMIHAGHTTHSSEHTTACKIQQCDEHVHWSHKDDLSKTLIKKSN